MKTNQIRQKFLDFFAKKNHIVEPSSSLIPFNDKTLLFVNAGMVPFKDVFSGVEKRPYTRATSSQRCIRAGGKHNDLENVGYTARHHTFFEMLGNFSFGDYFKEEAIVYAWEFLTIEMKIPADKLWVSVYEEDREAEEIWIKKIGFPKNRISRCGAKDNFWQMGDTGPCGPCSEIFYDHGAEISGGPPGTADEDGDRFIEIWNLVFTQFDRQEDGYLKPLDKPCVDTGMGLERLAAVMQHKNNNYDIDSFVELTKKIVKLANNSVLIQNPSVRVIADHIRSVSFLIADGILPSNEGRGYVLRRIIRRALRHGHKIGIDNEFLYLLASNLAYLNQEVYPILSDNLELIEKTIKTEEQKFSQTLNAGMGILECEINKLTGTKISGDIVFKLYDTYGFPLDLTNDIARERNLSIDKKGFNKLMDEQKERARKAGDFKATNNLVIHTQSEFDGYNTLNLTSKVIAIIQDNKPLDKLDNTENAILILEKTPFYAQSGGQTGDVGQITVGNNIFLVTDTQKQKSGAFEHYGKCSGVIKVGDVINAKVDKNNHLNIARNHSATHLLHAILKKVLGENVNQKGSLVDSEKLRFDFSYDKAIDTVDLLEIERLVNKEIIYNLKVRTEITDIKNAKKQGAMALFGEKYEAEVRVLTMGKNNLSIELCGGTHIKNLGDIGSFRIISESGIASGIRRIEAFTALKAYEFDKNNQQILLDISKLLKTDDSVVKKVENLIQKQKELIKQIDSIQKKAGSDLATNLAKEAQDINGIKVISTEVKDIKTKDLVDLVDKLKAKLKSAIIILAVVEEQKISLITGVTKNLIDKYHAGKIIASVAQVLDGKGGGRPDMARGGGTNIKQLNKALLVINEFI